MKVLYVPSLNVGVIYWRIENYANEFVRLKSPVFVEYLVDPKMGYAWDKLCMTDHAIGETIRRKLEEAFQFFDVIIFQKIQNKEGIYLIKKLKDKYPKVKMIAEIDDSIGDITPSSFREMKDEAKWAAEHVRISDGVICSTDYLKESVKGLNKTSFVAPNCIDYDHWESKKDKIKVEITEPGEYRIAYVAGGGHDEDLELFYEPILNVLDRNKFVKFHIRYGGYIPSWLKKHSQIVFKQVSWSIDEYSNRLRELNAKLAIAPLRDSDFNRCKSNLKYLEWGSIGVPLFCSKVEPYIKTNGELYLTTNDKDKIEKNLEELIKKDMETPIDREKLKEEIRVKYSLSENASRLINWLDEIKLDDKIESDNQVDSKFKFI